MLTVHRIAEDEEAIWQAVRQVLDEALKRFISMREREGEALKEDILKRADTILGAVKVVEERSPSLSRSI